MNRLFILVLAVLHGVKKCDGSLTKNNYSPYTIKKSSTSILPVTLPNERKAPPDSSSACALILERRQKPQDIVQIVPSSFSELDRQPSQDHAYDKRKGPPYEIVREESGYPLNDYYGLDYDYNRYYYPRGYYHHPHYRYKRQTTEEEFTDVCVTYADINSAFKDASKKTSCKRSKKPPGSESTIKEITKASHCIMEVAQLIAKRFQMTPDEITNALPLIDTSKTRVYDICTANLKPKPCTAERFSDISGVCNNLRNPTWGANRTPFKRLLPPVYEDGFNSFRKSVVDGEELPLVRKISTSLHKDVGRPSRLSQMFMEFGQVLAHDITFAAPTFINGLDFKCCGIEPSMQNKNCLTIEIPEDDPFHGPAGRTCMEFKRTLSGQRERCGLGPREQISDLTHMIDANFIYGSSTDKSNLLRTFQDGLLETALPDSFERNGLKPILPPRTKLPDKGCIGRNRTNGLHCFEAGDGRVNENIFMVALQTIFLREHNRLARELKELNPFWNDERLYQESRRIMIGMYQHIVYNEYLPAILGLEQIENWNLTLSSGYWNGYDATVNMAVASSFMSASFRFSHSNVDNKVERYNKFHQRIASHDLREFFRRPFAFYEAGIVDEFILGMVDQAMQDTDAFMSSEVTNHLFQKVKQSFGIDLAATNIKRGRDHGLPSYNDFREFCGLPRANNFQELATILQNNTVQVFTSLYKDVDDIDLWSGGISETHLTNAEVGPTFACLIGQQFRDLRQGDRFWYENPGWPSSFSPEQLRELKKITMAKMICDNGDDIETIQLFTMELAESTRNPRFDCDNIPGIDLSLWQELPSSGPAFFSFT